VIVCVLLASEDEADFELDVGKDETLLVLLIL
jgi:hypothetical protein